MYGRVSISVASNSHSHRVTSSSSTRSTARVNSWTTTTMIKASLIECADWLDELRVESISLATFIFIFCCCQSKWNSIQEHDVSLARRALHDNGQGNCQCTHKKKKSFVINFVDFCIVHWSLHHGRGASRHIWILFSFVCFLFRCGVVKL